MAHAHKHHGAERVVKGKELHASSDMNVTPLIDVLLVLLIIFMAALPLTQKGVDINLPIDTQNNKDTPQDISQIVVEYNAGRQMAVNKQPVTMGELENRLRNIFEQRKDKTMFIVGDPGVRYGEIVEIIDAARGAGVEKVGIVTMEAITKRPVVVSGPDGDVIAIRSIMNMVLAVDHRANDGAGGAALLRDIKAWLEAVGPGTAIY